MKKAVLLPALLSLAFLFLIGCQDETVNVSAPDDAIENAVEPFKVELVSSNGTLDDVNTGADLFSRTGCALSSDEGCSDVNHDGIVDDFNLFCTTYPVTTTFNGNIVD